MTPLTAPLSDPTDPTDGGGGRVTPLTDHCHGSVSGDTSGTDLTTPVSQTGSGPARDHGGRYGPALWRRQLRSSVVAGRAGTALCHVQDVCRRWSRCLAPPTPAVTAPFTGLSRQADAKATSNRRHRHRGGSTSTETCRFGRMKRLYRGRFEAASCPAFRTSLPRHLRDSLPPESRLRCLSSLDLYKLSYRARATTLPTTASRFPRPYASGGYKNSSGQRCMCSRRGGDRVGPRREVMDCVACFTELLSRAGDTWPVTVSASATWIQPDPSSTTLQHPRTLTVPLLPRHPSTTGPISHRRHPMGLQTSRKYSACGVFRPLCAALGNKGELACDAAINRRLERPSGGRRRRRRRRGCRGPVEDGGPDVPQLSD